MSIARERLKPQETRMKVIKHGWPRHGSVGTLVAYGHETDIYAVRFDNGEIEHYPREALDIIRGKVK